MFASPSPGMAHRHGQGGDGSGRPPAPSGCAPRCRTAGGLRLPDVARPMAADASRRSPQSPSHCLALLARPASCLSVSGRCPGLLLRWLAAGITRRKGLMLVPAASAPLLALRFAGPATACNASHATIRTDYSYHQSDPNWRCGERYGKRRRASIRPLKPACPPGVRLTRSTDARQQQNPLLEPQSRPGQKPMIAP